MTQFVTEKAFQTAVVELAELCGWKVYHTYDSRRSAPGFPDLVLGPGNRAAVLGAEGVQGAGRRLRSGNGWTP